MNGKWTRGPLIVSGDTNSNGFRAIRKGPLILAQVWIPSAAPPDQSNEAERDANANLYAAAPALYGAVEALLNAPALSRGPGSTTIAVRDCDLRAARMALAIANGKGTK